MSVRSFAKLTTASLMIGCLIIPTVGRASDERKPNILVIVSDDQGFADVGFNGCKDIPTPNLDALARGGVCFKNGYVSGPYCSPTRAGFLTGRYQQRFGHEFNPGGQKAEGIFGLPLSETTLANHLKAAGYATGLVGKWHLGSDPIFQPQQRGFDEFFGFLGGEHSYFDGRLARETEKPGSNPIYRGTEVVEEKQYLTDAFEREAISFIDRHQQHPFFLYLAFNAVHTPLHATDERLKRFARIEDPTRRTYAAMLSALDDSVGKVIEKLKASGLEKDTLIVFFSDNGGPTMLGTTINGSRNEPFRGSKRTTLEGGVHVPFVIQWAGKLPAGTYEPPVIQLDVLPTVLAAAGIEANPDWKLDGVNLLPYLNGQVSGSPHQALYWRLGEQAAIRRGDWKLVRYDKAVDEPGTLSNPQARDNATSFRLYNLAHDPGESQDLASTNPTEFQALLDAWLAWDAQLAKPLWGPAAGITASTP